MYTSNTSLKYVTYPTQISSLLLDGVTGGVQEDLRKHNVGSYTLMMHMNFWSIIYLVPVTVFSGEVSPFMEFIKRHPHILYDMSIFGLTSAVGQ
ncbi:uncharacterized protein DC041_0005667, partial [Schistosoma bovis]